MQCLDPVGIPYGIAWNASCPNATLSLSIRKPTFLESGIPGILNTTLHLLLKWRLLDRNFRNSRQSEFPSGILSKKQALRFPNFLFILVLCNLAFASEAILVLILCYSFGHHHCHESFNLISLRLVCESPLHSHLISLGLACELLLHSLHCNMSTLTISFCVFISFPLLALFTHST